MHPPLKRVDKTGRERRIVPRVYIYNFYFLYFLQLKSHGINISHHLYTINVTSEITRANENREMK